MLYSFLPHREAESVSGVSLLATVPDVDWGVYAVGEPCDPATLVPERLARLIRSGARYPPALALAREEVVEVFDGHRPSFAEFTTAYGAAIRAYLSRQVDAPFLLAEALEDEGSALRAGELYWVLQVTGTPAVASWVSDEFRVLDTPADRFDLTGRQLRRLASG